MDASCVPRINHTEGSMQYLPEGIRGAAVMDVKYPNWELAIDPDRIDIESDKWCVFGQLFGSFKRGCKALGLTLEQATALGFHAPEGSPKNIASQYYAQANRTWRMEIERRMPAFV